MFEGADFAGTVRFSGTYFTSDAYFDEVRFGGEVWLAAAELTMVTFKGAVFEGLVHVSRVHQTGEPHRLEALSEAVFVNGPPRGWTSFDPPDEGL